MIDLGTTRGIAWQYQSVSSGCDEFIDRALRSRTPLEPGSSGSIIFHQPTTHGRTKEKIILFPSLVRFYPAYGMDSWKIVGSGGRIRRRRSGKLFRSWGGESRGFFPFPLQRRYAILPFEHPRRNFAPISPSNPGLINATTRGQINEATVTVRNRRAAFLCRAVESN